MGRSLEASTWSRFETDSPCDLGQFGAPFGTALFHLGLNSGTAWAIFNFPISNSLSRFWRPTRPPRNETVCKSALSCRFPCRCNDRFCLVLSTALAAYCHKLADDSNGLFSSIACSLGRAFPTRDRFAPHLSIQVLFLPCPRFPLFEPLVKPPPLRKKTCFNQNAALQLHRSHNPTRPIVRFVESMWAHPGASCGYFGVPCAQLGGYLLRFLRGA